VSEEQSSRAIAKTLIRRENFSSNKIAKLNLEFSGMMLSQARTVLAVLPELAAQIKMPRRNFVRISGLFLTNHFALITYHSG